MKATTTAVYVFSGTSYFLVALWMIYLGKFKNRSQWLFLAWLVAMTLTSGLSGVIPLSPTLTMASIYFKLVVSCVLLQSALILVFALSLHHEPRENDVLFFLPLLVAAPLTWTTLVSKSPPRPGEFIPQLNFLPWAIVAAATLFFYGMAVFLLSDALRITKRIRKLEYAKRLRLIIVGVIFVPIITNIVIPLQRFTPLGPSARFFWLLLPIPAVLIALAFRRE